MVKKISVTASMAAFVVALIPLPAHAQDAGKACATIADSLLRLSCFDKAFPRESVSSSDQSADASAANTQPTTSAESTSAWQAQEEKSALDDSAIYTAYLTATSASKTGFGNADAFLVLRCAENTTTAVFSTNLFMMDEQPSVTIRIGDDKATTTRWTRSTSYKSAGLWSGAQAIPFIKALPDNTRLVVRITDKDRLDAEFDLGDVSRHVAKLREHCKW